MRLKVLGSAEDALRAMTEQLIEKNEYAGNLSVPFSIVGCRYGPTNIRALDSGIPGENKMGAIEVLLGG